MSNPFPSGKRPWLRITAAKRSISDLILGKGELAVTDTGDVIVGNGATALKNRPALLDQVAAQQIYVTYDGNYLRKNGIAVELPSTGQVATAVTNAVNGLLNGAPGALDTLKELADAIGDDANYAASVTAALAARALALNVTGTKTAAYTAGLNELIPVDATSAGVTITLPPAPAAGTRVTVKKTDATTNTVTIARGGSTDVFNKTGGSTTLTLTLQNQSATIQYAGGVWYVSGGDLPLSSLQTSLSATYSTLAQLAANPDQLVVGTITRSATGAATGFGVVWPDGSTGTFTGTESATIPGAIDAYTVTKTKGGTTVTFTQTALTRDATGAVTNRPAITAA